MRLPAALTALAVAAALAGTAVAGSGPTAESAGKLEKAAKQAKEAKKKAKKALKLAKSKEQDAAPDGAQGETGDQGAAGDKGDAGDDFASTLTSRILPLSTDPALEYGPVTGFELATTTQNAVKTLSPNVDVVIRDLAVLVTSSPGTGNSHAFTIRAPGATTVTCTISGAADSCNSGGATHTVPAGSELSISILTTGNPAPADAQIGFRATTP